MLLYPMVVELAPRQEDWLESYMASIPTNELNNLFTTYSTKVGNRWDGKETARGCSRKLSLGLDLRFHLGLGLRLDDGLGLRLVLGLVSGWMLVWVSG